MRLALFVFFFLNGFFTQVMSQDVPIGKWRDHLPYRTIKHLAETQNYLYAASNSGVIRVDLEDNSAQRFSTVEGLVDVEVSAMEASPDGSTLLIGYKSGVIDVVLDNRIIHVYDVFRSSVIGDKTINHFLFYNNLCYISTGFGIVSYDYKNLETRETFLIGENGDYVFVNQTHFFQDTLWAATNEGLYRAPYASFLYNPSSWARDTTLPDSAKPYNMVSSLGNELMVNVYSPFFRQDTLYSRVNGKWGINPFRIGESNKSIESYGDKVIISASTSVEVYDTDWSIIRREFSFGESMGISPEIAKFGKNDILWIGDDRYGLGKNFETNSTEVINLGGPSSNRAFNVFYDNDLVFVTGGAHAENWFTLKQQAEFSYFKENKWSVFNRNTLDTFKSVSDVTSVSVDPNNSQRYFVNSLNEGIFEFIDDKLVNNYTPKNSLLDTARGICFVSDLKFDQDGNLWILNSLTNNPIVMLSSTGTWHRFPVSINGETFQTGRLTFSDEGYLWITSPTGGLLVYDPGNDLTLPSDDRYRQFTASPGNGNLPDNETYCAIQDKDGQIWIGTRVGLRTFSNSSNAFSSSYADAQDILIQSDGQTKILLENENLPWIAVDGANRKWVATRNSGAFLLSADGAQELAHFTVENSPIFSNYINSLAINGKTGEVLMATDKGLIGYRGEVTEGGNNFSDVYAFPNPVKSNYTGVIAIRGLTDGASIKITDTGGGLVHETTSQGGQATWDGNNLQGQRAFTGVYFVVAQSKNGEERVVTKILVLR